MDYQLSQQPDNSLCIETALSDFSLLSNPILNKGLAFTDEERDLFDLHGLLPAGVASLEVQISRAYQAFQRKSTDLEKYVSLRSLQDSNEVLFYSLVHAHIEEMMPIIYTPVVGEACVKAGNIFRRPRGLFLSYPNRKRIDHLLSHPRFDHTRAIVVSDGERILGLGDQGAGGMGIPVGKLSLYTACAGIHPAHTLPILLDTGTNNPDHFKDPLYIGWRHERVRGKDYDDFINLFVTAIKKRFPHVLLQWEDFAQPNAHPILERYHDQLCTFNDDIQGTAAVATGALLAAVQSLKSKIRDQRIIVVGSGSAGCGISDLMLQAMIDEGLPKEKALQNFYLIDRNGLLLSEHSLLPFQKIYGKSRQDLSGWKIQNPSEISLMETIQNVEPTLLIGVSGQGGLFKEELIREMARHVKRPIIFPLSNPTSRSEAKPSDLMEWTEGRAIIGTGSPFPNLTRNGKSMRVDQSNNAYIFPGMGLGILSVKAKRVTPSMFMAAAKALAACSPAINNPEENLLPPLNKIREVSFVIAKAVAQEAIAAGKADRCSSEDLVKKIKKTMWTPAYPTYKRTLA